MRMVKIYWLVDTRTDTPFYVGATVSNERSRLCGHIRGDSTMVQGGVAMERYEFIQDMMLEGFRPEIFVVKTVPFNEADYWESLYFRELTKRGFKLFQSENFYYQKTVRRIQN